MLFKRRLFGFSVKDVEEKLSDYENLIELQRKDIEYLKRDNNILKNTITLMSKDNNTIDKN